ncbi:auxin-responsive protein [Salix suchowensis]|nr:auxin-responsive protein [Salix suchowensis]
MSEEESGLPKNAPVTFLCDAMLMEYAATLMQTNADKDMEKALLMSIAGSSRCSLFFHHLHQEKSSQQAVVC